jgi:hypothetical protein
MTQHRDIEHVLDAWLAEGPTQVPDRVFDDAIARMYRQPQPSAWRPRWRTRYMNTSLRLLAAGVAAIAVDGVAVIVLRPSSTVGPPAATPTATAPASPSPTPTPTSIVEGATRLPSGGPIESGRYFIEKSNVTPVTFSFTLPAGWLANGGSGVLKHPDETGRETGFGVSVVDSVFADPCGGNDRLEVGPSAEQLADGLSGLPGIDASTPTAVSIGGRSGFEVEVSVAADVDIESCDPPIGLQVWIDRGGTYFVAGPELVARIYMVDVNGERFVLRSGHGEATAPNDLAELAAVIESIEFHP